MTTEILASSARSYAELAARFRPLFADIAQGAARRESGRILLHDEVRRLAEAGFTSLRVPSGLGGGGVSAPDFFRLLIELAAAESNLAQALRCHIAFVEDLLYANNTKWLRRIADGAVVGNAWTESGPVPVGGVSTTITVDGAGYRVNGTKSYTTGSLYADWIQTGARTAEGLDVIALVRRDNPGVEVIDDWDGFGQRLTASGTSVFTNVFVPAADVITEAAHPPYSTGVYQLIHVATLAGIARAALGDVVSEVRKRTRTFSNGNGTRPSADIQVQQVVGEVSALAFSAEAASLRVAELVQEAYEAQLQSSRALADAAVTAVEFASSQAQIVVTEQVQRAASLLFNALGASSTRQELQLDRHWRNARTISSHNPVIYKSRIVGDWEINGTIPDFVWRAGEAPAPASASAR